MKSQEKAHKSNMSSSGADQHKKWYLLISNPSKTTHLGTLLRCAAAFRVHQVLLVGCDKFNYQGSFGSHLFCDIVVFPSWDSVHEYLRRGGEENADGGTNANDATCHATIDETNGGGKCANTNEVVSAGEQSKNHNTPHSNNIISIIGILGAYGGGDEIFSPDGMTMHDDMGYVSLARPEGIENTDNPHCESVPEPCLQQRSFPVSTRPFSTHVCFMLSKEKRGLPLHQARMCEGFVHVPHPSFGGNTPLTQKAHASKSLTPLPDKARKQPSPTPSIALSYLLDTATIMSIVLHHFTAWARYDERTFAENQKFVKDIKPDARRRLCRVVGEKQKKRGQNEEDERAECNNAEQDAIDAMMLWKDTGGTTKSSDY